MVASVDWPLVLQGTKIVLDALAEASWPMVIGGVVWAFKEPIEKHIGRIKQLRGFGGEAEFAALDGPKQNQLEQEAGVNALAPQGGIGTEFPPPNSVYDVLDQAARRDLETHIHGQPEKMLAWAIRMRSISEANRIHERNYRLIFGSQLQALKALNQVGRAPAADFEPMFRAVAESEEWKAVHQGRTFEEWGQFLINTAYIRLIEGTEPAEVEITPFGQQFLLWLVEARVPENRAA